MSAQYDLYETPDIKQTGEKQPLHPRIVPKGTIGQDEFLDRVHKFTGISRSLLAGAMQSFQNELKDLLANGWIVELGEIGYFSVSLKCDRQVTDKKEIRSPSVHFQNVNLRLGSKFRNRFNTMELERKASPYVSRSLMGEEERKEKLLLHLDKYGCITRADYESITGLVKHRAVSDLNRYLAEGMIRKYGSGKTVVYLKP
mgnify:CR=1 FL=1